MSPVALKAMFERTIAVQRNLVIAGAVPGVIITAVAVATGFPVLIGLGIAILAGCLFGFLSLRRKRAVLLGLLENPDRVVQVVPVVQQVGGMVVNHPVVLVTSDGEAFRVATFAGSVEQALQPFLEKFPHARGADADAVFAPDAGFGTRFKIIGVMLGSLVLGAVGALLWVAPSVIRRVAEIDEAVRVRTAQDETQTRALEALRSADLPSAWSSCAVKSLEPSIEVVLDGAVEGIRTHRRSGWLIKNLELTVEESEPRRVYPPDRIGIAVDALMGQRHEAVAKEELLSVVGVRREGMLALRLIALDDGAVRCEGRAAVAPSEKGSRYAEDKALAAAVMRPFCTHLKRDTCAELGPAPADAMPGLKGPANPTADEPTPQTLTPSAIQGVVRAASDRTRACYEKALKKKPSLTGRVTVAFTIAADGRVAAASGTGFPDKTVTNCVVKEFKALRFPPHPAGKATPVKYPIVFQTTK